MTTPHDTHSEPGDRGFGHGAHPARGGHGWMMIACCIPMLVIAVVLVATGVAGSGSIVVALACTAMMALMMRGMHDGGHEHGSGADVDHPRPEDGAAYEHSGARDRSPWGGG